MGYLCNPGFFGADSIQSCSPTSIQYDCGPIDEYDVCSDSTITRERTRSESLGSAYTINDVVQNVDTMLARVGGLVYSQMPAYTSGYVLNGTGHSALTWDPGAQNAASFTRGDTWVSKTRLYIKFLADTKYYLNEQEFQATKDQQIIVDAEEGDIVAFTPYCSKGFVPNSELDFSGTKTTRTPEGAATCTYWTGPDCKQYNTKTTTMEAESSMSNSASVPGYGQYQVSGESSWSETTVEKIGPNFPNCYDVQRQNTGLAQNEWESSTNAGTCGFFTGDGECTNSITNDEVTVVSGYSRWDAPGGECFDAEEREDYSDANPCEAYLFKGESCGQCNGTVTTPGTCTPHYTGSESGSVSSSRTTSSSLGGTTYTCNVTSSYDYNCSHLWSPNAVPGVRETVTENNNASSTYTVVFSNGDDEDADAGWETETETNTSGCAGNYDGPNFKWQSNALIIWDATYTLPQSDQAISYTAWFHHVLETNDTSDPDCPYRTMVAVNDTFGVQSTGGQRLVTTSISVATPGKGQTTCVRQSDLSAFLLKN